MHWPRARLAPPFISSRSPVSRRLRHWPLSRATEKRLSLSLCAWSYSGGVSPSGCSSHRLRRDSPRVANSAGFSISESPPWPRHSSRDVRLAWTRLSSPSERSIWRRNSAPVAMSSSVMTVSPSTLRPPLKTPVVRL